LGVLALTVAAMVATLWILGRFLVQLLRRILTALSASPGGR
jgi:hypothetical protein